MKIRGLHTGQPTFVDTPKGIYTASGVWFRTTEASLRAYAPAVLDKEPLPRLLRQADVWLRGPQTLALWLLPAFLLLLPPLAASLATLVVYVGWKGLGPSFVNRPLYRVLAVLDLVLVQAIYYVFMLSLFVAQEQYATFLSWPTPADPFTAFGVGIAGFVLLRWGIIRWVTRPLLERIWAGLYALPVPDQVLRAFILRAALKHRLAMPELDRMEQEILAKWIR